jgi:hypothetical protein
VCSGDNIRGAAEDAKRSAGENLRAARDQASEAAEDTRRSLAENTSRAADNISEAAGKATGRVQGTFDKVGPPGSQCRNVHLQAIHWCCKQHAPPTSLPTSLPTYLVLCCPLQLKERFSEGAEQARDRMHQKFEGK